MRSDSLKKAQQKYAKDKQIRKGVAFTVTKDVDLLCFLEQSEEAFGSMCKRLIRKEMEDQGYEPTPEEIKHIQEKKKKKADDTPEE